MRSVVDRGWLAEQTVYNLNVDDIHTSVVAVDGVDLLVHNSSCWNGLRPPKRTKNTSARGNGYKGKSYGYQINHGGTNLFKYGISRGSKKNLAKRLQKGLRRCNRKHNNTCSVVSVRHFKDGYSARMWEWRKCASFALYQRVEDRIDRAVLGKPWLKRRFAAVDELSVTPRYTDAGRASVVEVGVLRAPASASPSAPRCRRRGAMGGSTGCSATG